VDYFERLQKIAPFTPVTVRPAYRIHFSVGGAYIHPFAYRGEAQRIWNAKANGLVANAEHAQVYPDTELHELLVNSLFSAEEVHAIAKYFIEKYGLEIVVTPQSFPLPLPYSYGYLVFHDDEDEPEDFVVGQIEAKLPTALLAFVHHAVGEHCEVWTESDFADDFTPKNRIDILTKSFVLEPDKAALPVPFPLYCFAEPEDACFLDELRGVHDKISSHRASVAKEARHDG
jgi:hypothetical protein